MYIIPFHNYKNMAAEMGLSHCNVKEGFRELGNSSCNVCMTIVCMSWIMCHYIIFLFFCETYLELEPFSAVFDDTLPLTECSLFLSLGLLYIFPLD